MDTFGHSNVFAHESNDELIASFPAFDYLSCVFRLFSLLHDSRLRRWRCELMLVDSSQRMTDDGRGSYVVTMLPARCPAVVSTGRPTSLFLVCFHAVRALCILRVKINENKCLQCAPSADINFVCNSNEG